MSVTLSKTPIAPGALLDGFCANRSETGAVASFTGLVRAEQGVTQALEPESYEGFAEKQIEAMVASAVERFSLQDALVVHRIGRIGPGEAVRIIAAAAPHRKAALEACDHLTDYLKSRAPFWKKEHGPDGERWIEPTIADHQDAARWDEATK